MLNQIVLVGRLCEDIRIKEEGEKRVVRMTLAIPRSYKNENGDYDTDLIGIVLWEGLATNVEEFCKKGDLIGVKGRIQANEDKTIEIVAEKLTFLSSKKEEE